MISLVVIYVYTADVDGNAEHDFDLPFLIVTITTLVYRIYMKYCIYCLAKELELQKERGEIQPRLEVPGGES